MTTAEIKTALVAAHRSQDWEAAKRLSQEKQKAKKKPRCVVCGVRFSKGGGQSTRLRCTMHSIVNQFYERRLSA